MQQVVHRRLDCLVMLGKGAVVQARGKELAQPLSVHDEGPIFAGRRVRLGSQGLPSASAEARLYMMRRLAGHEKAQLWYMPRPVGSAVERRCALLPASVYTPEWSQLPHDVEPSAWSWPKPSICWPA